MKNDSPENSVRWTPVIVFVTLATLLSSLWAQYARTQGWTTNPQDAGLAASIAQAGVLASALVTMRFFARDAFRRIGWRVGPWTAYTVVFCVVTALVALMSFALLFGFQRLTGGTVIPSDSQPGAIPFLLVFACIFAFAQEFGWRGYLLPQLLPLGIRQGLLLSGVLWFCWEMPLIHFGLLDSALIQVSLPQTLLCRFLETCALAVIFGYLRLRFDSVFLPTFAHGLIISLSSVSFLFFTEANPLLSDFGSPVGTALTLVVAGLVWRQVGRDLARGILPGPAATSDSQKIAPAGPRGSERGER